MQNAPPKNPNASEETHSEFTTHHSEFPHPSLFTLVIVYSALMLLLALTVGAATITSGASGLTIALAIAAAKALLVVLFFMHVKYASRVTWIFSGTALIWLGIMFTLTLSDFLTRGWLARDAQLSPAATLVKPPPGVTRQPPEGLPINPEKRTRR